MKIIRIISLVLALLMVMSCFISCKKIEEDGEETTVSTTSAVDEYNPMYDEDGGGRDFVFLTRDHSETYTYSYAEVGAVAAEGDRVSSAVYNRDAHIASTFNINIVTEPVLAKNYASSLEKDVFGGVGGYDVVVPMIATAFSAATKGYLLETDLIPYVDVEKDYWNRNIYDSSSIAGNTFFLVGEANISSYNSVGALFFNKKLVEDQKLDDPYTLVKDNQWTFTKMKEMCATVTEDIDGDASDMTYKDRWGFCTSGYMWMPLFYSSGYYMIEKDVDDMPYVSGISVENSMVVGDLLTQIITFLNDPTTCLLTNDPKNEGFVLNVGENLRCDMFISGDRTLFWMEGIYGQTYLRQMESNYGILPIPKWNTESPFASIAHSQQTSCMALPTTSQDLKLAGAVLEEMAKFSAGELKEEFYEQTIRVRGSRDDDSFEMLDYLYENIVMDMALIMTESKVAIDSTIRGMVTGNNPNVSGMFSSMGGGFKLVIDELALKLIDEAASQHAALEG